MELTIIIFMKELARRIMAVDEFLTELNMLCACSEDRLI